MTHEFILQLDGPDIMNDVALDALYETGLDDTTFGTEAGQTVAAVHREAPSLVQAIISAIQQIEQAVPGLRVVRVQTDDIVSASEIADRLGVGRAAVSLWIQGKRGPQGFPAPFESLSPKRPLWRWNDVVAWLQAAGKMSTFEWDKSAIITAVNAALEYRNVAPSLPAAGREALRGLIPS